MVCVLIWSGCAPLRRMLPGGRRADCRRVISTQWQTLFCVTVAGRTNRQPRNRHISPNLSQTTVHPANSHKRRKAKVSGELPAKCKASASGVNRHADKKPQGIRPRTAPAMPGPLQTHSAMVAAVPSRSGAYRLAGASSRLLKGRPASAGKTCGVYRLPAQRLFLPGTYWLVIARSRRAKPAELWLVIVDASASTPLCCAEQAKACSAKCSSRHAANVRVCGLAARHRPPGAMVVAGQSRLRRCSSGSLSWALAAAGRCCGCRSRPPTGRRGVSSYPGGETQRLLII